MSSPCRTLDEASGDIEKDPAAKSSFAKDESRCTISHPAQDTALAVEQSQPAPLGKWRKLLVFTFLCSAQFFDIFNSGSAIAALPEFVIHLKMSPGAVQWVLSAYTLTLGAFMVPAGRLADIYHPKPVFCAGYLALGLFSVVCGASVASIMLFVFRALAGVGAAMTIPSAISMIVQIYPDPQEKNKALGIFGAAGALGGITGVTIGGILTAEVSWRWVFYIVAVLATPFSAVSYFVIPNDLVPPSDGKRSLDLPGVGVLTAGLILFVYALSDASSVGWGSAQILAPLVLSIVCFAAFFVVERYVKDPAIPPRTWSNKNFTAMFFYSWSVYWSLFAVQLLMIQTFQDIFHWSIISSALHFIPIGAVAGTSGYLTGRYGHLVPRRALLAGGQILMGAGVVLYALTDAPHKYWTRFFPGVLLNMSGLSAAYVGSTTTTMAGARAGEEGVVGAAQNTSYQIGSTIGIAVVTAVSLGVNAKLPGDPLAQHAGYAAAFWSVLGMHGVMLIVTFLCDKRVLGAASIAANWAI